MRMMKLILAGLAVATMGVVSMGAENEGVMVQFWGTSDGKAVKLYTLTNENGMVAKVTNFGAILTELWAPDRDGEMADVVLGFEELGPYVAGHPFFGATAGRYANRIARGKFQLGGKEYTLATNNAPNHLHGGDKGFDKHVWDAEPTVGEDGPGVMLTLVSPDGDEGSPGTLTAKVHYVLTNDNELRVEMTATTDALTVVNLAHHTYWNLGGHGSGEVLDHVMRINADRYTPTDDTLIPTGDLALVVGTPYDFRSAKTIGEDIEGISIGGYDINFVLNGEMGTLREAARVSEPDSGRVMTVLTTEPGVQLYSGIHLNNVAGKEGASYNKGHGFCLETQHYPDSPNKPNFPSTALAPGQEYRHVMVHRFTTE